MHKLSEAMLRQGVERAPQIERLPDQVDLEILPAGSPDLPVIGVDDETLQPAEILAKGPLLLAGPPGCRPHRGAGDPGLRAAPLQPRRRTDLHRLPAIRGGVPEALGPLRGGRRTTSRRPSRSWWTTPPATPGKLAIFIEGLTEFTDTGAESGIERLVTASIKADQWVVGESETSTWSSAWSLAQPFKSGRRGLLLNPGDIDGDSLLSTSLGRISTDFIPGRGYIVGRGKVRKLQVALPPENRN